ncbi:MAG: NAD(P)H-dependent oxidoreductase [bacterium]
MSLDRNIHKILVLFAHPAIHKSRVNRRLAHAARQVEGVTFHDLYEAYHDLHIDVKEEQRLLEAHDVVVLQHPFFWYSTPAILKEWQDLVLEHGWAYGHAGTALHGKLLLNAITTGGPEQAYRKGGHNRFTMRELLAPLEQTAILCGMTFLPPFVVHGTHLLEAPGIELAAEEYRRLLEGFRDRRIDLEAAQTRARLNEDLDAILRDGSQNHAR